MGADSISPGRPAELAGTVRDVLSASILSLASDSSSDSVLLTFATPKVLREPEDPQYHTFEKLVPIPGSLSRIVRLQTPTVAGGKWSRQSSTDGGRARYKAPFGERGLEFEINLVLDPKTPDQVRITRSWLSTSWPGFLPDKLAKLLDDQQKAKKTLDELPDNASDDRKSKAQENYRSLSDSIRDCKGEIAMYSQIVDLKADLILPNKVVLAEIVVPKPPVASPDAKSGH